MELKSLTETSFETLSEAFAEAFADYEVQINGPQLRRMLLRRGFVPELSFAAFGEGRIVAFTLNGIGNYDGIPTAYDTGTGTIEAYRGQRLATRVFEHSIPYLKRANVSRYLLEVLQHNTKAVSVYRKLGFEVTREFNYFSQETARIDCRAARPDSRTPFAASTSPNTGRWPDSGISAPRGRTVPNPSQGRRAT